MANAPLVRTRFRLPRARARDLSSGYFHRDVTAASDRFSNRRVSPTHSGSRARAADRCHQTGAFEENFDTCLSPPLPPPFPSLSLSSLQFTFHFSSCIFISTAEFYFIFHFPPPLPPPPPPRRARVCISPFYFIYRPTSPCFFPRLFSRVRSSPRPLAAAAAIARQR